MLTKRFSFLLVLLALVFGNAVIGCAQDATATQPPTMQDQPDPQQQQQEKVKLEKKATALLEQVIAEAQSLRLPENRIRVQITAADMLWDRNQGRALSLFTEAGASVAQLTVGVDRGDRDEVRGLAQLRQDLVLTAARHDADLAYQLLRSTQSQTPDQNAANGRRGAPQGNLDQSLLAAVAATDPKVAYQKAVESLDKGEYPSSLSKVLAQLKVKDKEDFKKLSDKALGKLGSDALLSSRDAGSLAMSLLRLGPSPESTSDTSSGDNSSSASATPAPAGATNGTGSTAAANNNSPVLSQSAFHDLMDTTITAAMSATPLAPGANNFRGGRGGPRGQQTTDQQTPPDDAQIQQTNARTLLMGLQSMLPQIDQYLPDRAQSVRQKVTELGMGNNQMIFGQQMRTAMQGGTSDSLLAAANVAPPQMQSRLYQQAALKAVDEGNTDKATQIATDHLDETTRASVIQAVDIKKMSTTASPEKLGEIRLKLASLPSDADRVKFLIALAAALQKDNPKLALKFLDDAKTLVSKRATNYKDFEQQLAVADAYSTLDPKRSFDVLEPGIGQLNELLSAAAVLNGFEVEIFKDGELPLRGGNDLSNMVVRYAQELASLSKLDFEQAKATADRFQLPEPRLLAKLSIVQSLLGVQPIAPNGGGFGGLGGRGVVFGRGQ
jgi:hypothetical protein